VLAVPLPSERLTGCVLYLDKRRLSYDDVAVGTIGAREIMASLDQAELLARQRESAVSDERTRLGRDLHDGLLQSLTAARLQLHQLTRQVSRADDQAAQKLQALEAAMAANQRDLRMLVEQLRPGKAASRDVRTWVEAVEHLREGMRRDWGLDVVADVNGQVPAEIGHDVFLMIHEALVNAARHGRATRVDLRVTGDNQSLRVSVVDNGCGFAFNGRRDHLQLAAEHIGPSSLRERVASLNGTLVVDSSSGGACVEISIPATVRESWSQ
jgi:signal transduction histidine kinase